MERNCLIIMPTGDQDGYPQGHFNRVYEYVIVPACKAAGFVPTRINDSIALSGDILDVFRNIVQSGVTICDLSARNENVAYGFAMRNVLNLPVVLVKDLKTQMPNGIGGIDTVNYDESLRIDTVQAEINILTEAINRAYDQRGEPHALLSEITNRPAAMPEANSSEAKKEKALPIISPLPEYVGEPFTQEELNKLKVNDSLFHLTRGKGSITSVKNAGREKIAGINFESGSALLVLGASEYFRKIEE